MLGGRRLAWRVQLLCIWGCLGTPQSRGHCMLYNCIGCVCAEGVHCLYVAVQLAVFMYRCCVVGGVTPELLAPPLFQLHAWKP